MPELLQVQVQVWLLSAPSRRDCCENIKPVCRFAFVIRGGHEWGKRPVWAEKKSWECGNRPDWNLQPNDSSQSLIMKIIVVFWRHLNDVSRLSLFKFFFFLFQLKFTTWNWNRRNPTKCQNWVIERNKKKKKKKSSLELAKLATGCLAPSAIWELLLDNSNTVASLTCCVWPPSCSFGVYFGSKRHATSGKRTHWVCLKLEQRNSEICLLRALRMRQVKDQYWQHYILRNKQSTRRPSGE